MPKSLKDVKKPDTAWRAEHPLYPCGSRVAGGRTQAFMPYHGPSPAQLLFAASTLIWTMSTRKAKAIGP